MKPIANPQTAWAPKIRLALITGACLYVLLITQRIAADTLTIEVENVTSAEGAVMVQVLAGEAGFKGETQAAAALMKTAAPGTLTFVATDLQPGEYAIRVMHDVNGNGELDANFVGMPTEPWAMSNNARGNFGPPSWKEVKFSVDGDTTQTIKLTK